MDIEAISGAPVPPVIHPPLNRENVQSVEKAHLTPIDNEKDPYENIVKWKIKDKVTISSRARRKYNEMIAGNRQ